VKNLQIFSFLFSLLINGDFEEWSFIVATSRGAELYGLKNGRGENE